MSDEIVFQSGGIIEGGCTIQAKGRTRSNFSTAHLISATNAAANAHNVEKKNEGSDFGPSFDQMIIHVPVSIVMAAASIEAAVNEWAKDVLDASEQLGLSNSQLSLIQRLVGDRYGSALTRFDQLCVYLNIRRDADASWDKAATLLKLRNLFMHFKPVWSDENLARGEAELVTKLGSFGVALHPLFPTPSVLPYGLMTYGCALWAVEASFDFQSRCSQAHPIFTNRSICARK